MRYAVNQVVPVIKIEFDMAVERFIPLYCPWEGDKLKQILIKQLVVSEHHKVSWDQDPDGEKKYDGYVLTDKVDSSRWTNQYPRASYGQIDTSCDYRFYKEDADLFDYYVDGMQQLEIIHRGIQQLKTQKPEWSEMLTIHFNEVKDSIEKATGKKVMFDHAFKELGKQRPAATFDDSILSFYLE